jgi:hypothetical protein
MSKQGGKVVLDYRASPDQASAAAAVPVGMHALPRASKLVLDIVGNKNTLQVIDFSGAILDSSLIQELTESLQCLKNLKVLNLGGNNMLDISALSTLKDLLPFWPDLRELDLSHNNKLFQVGAAAPGPMTWHDPLNWTEDFAEGLSKCRHLQSIKLGGSGLTQDHLQKFLMELDDLKELSVLDLSNSPLGDHPSLEVCQFTKNSNCKEVNLSHCSINTQSVRPLLKLLTKNPELTLNLNGNFPDWNAPVANPAAPRPMHATAQPLVDLGRTRLDGLKQYLADICFGGTKDVGGVVVEYHHNSADSLTIYRSFPPLLALPVSASHAEAEAEAGQDLEASGNTLDTCGCILC